eukprot:457549-Lingulodinium_polyedra.AAC.1
MNVLGVRLDKRGSTAVPAGHRLGRGEAAFCALRPYLVDPTVPIRTRMERFVLRVVPIVLHGA